MAVDTDPASVRAAAFSERDRPMGSGGPTRRELALAWAALGAFALLVFASHILHGGFYLDDWSNGAGALFPPGGPGLGNALAYYAKLTLYRPVLIVYVPLTYFVLGTHMGYQIAWAVALAVAVSGTLYAILRVLGLRWVHAWIIAALAIVYPWSDSTRFWETASQASLAIALAFAGLWIALSGLESRSWRRHGCAALLYLLSILTYEITLPFIAAAGILYTARVGWRGARTRWGVDLLTVLAGGLWVGLLTTETQPVSGDFAHLREIITSGGTIIGRSAIPIGNPRTTLALAALGAVLIAGLAARLLGGERFDQQPDRALTRWLYVCGGGLVLAALGWVIFVPANPYYTPSVYGVTNRVNALAGVGLVIAIYGAIGVGATLVCALIPRMQAKTTAVTVVLGLALGAAYVHVLERHSRIWNAAYSAEAGAVKMMTFKLPHLPSGTTVFASDYPAYEAMGVPIFSANWDLNGMIKLQYKDSTLSAYPIIAGLTLKCSASGVGLQGGGAPPEVAPYGSARLINLATGAHTVPRNARECKSDASIYTAGPLYLSLSY
ncbi:MAG: hypothetical protein ACYCSI_11655 [Solirubrobacteraceae bacterium]